METKTKDQRSAEQLDDLNNLKRAQKNGDVPNVQANKDSSVEIPAHEAAGYVHVKVTEKHHNPAAKTYVEHSRVIPFHANTFDNMVKQGAFNLYDAAEIVHDPRKGTHKYAKNLKTEHVTEAAANADAPKGVSKGADMTAINKRKVELDKAAEALGNKESELETRESEIDQKTANLNKAIEELNAREAALAEKEKALNTPPAQQ